MELQLSVNVNSHRCLAQSLEIIMRLYILSRQSSLINNLPSIVQNTMGEPWLLGGGANQHRGKSYNSTNYVRTFQLPAETLEEPGR
jgi:hypothetical protein